MILTIISIQVNPRCYKCEVTSYYLSNLECNNNNLTNLDVTKNTALLSLHCDNNGLTSLDVSKNEVLMELCCNNNKLTSLDVSNNAGLRWLNCADNNLTSLDVNNCTNLEDLSAQNNEFSISSPFDLATLSGSFDVSKASSWRGGTVNGTILLATEDMVLYDYDCGTGFTRQFKLIVVCSVITESVWPFVWFRSTDLLQLISLLFSLILDNRVRILSIRWR